MKFFLRVSLVGWLALGSSLLNSSAQSILLNAGAIDTSQAATLSATRAVTATVAGSQLHLVQFDGPIQPEWVEQLIQDGYRIVDYIPDNAYLVYGGSSALKSVRTRATHLQWEGAYLASDKINPRARPEAAAARRALNGEDDLFAVQLVLDESANAETVALLTSLAKEPLKRNNEFRHYRNIVVRMAPAEVDTIAARPDVISIAPYVMPKKMDERQGMIVAGQLTGNGPTGPGYLTWLASKGFTQQQFTDSGLVVDVSDSGLDNGSTNANHFGLYVSGNTGQTSRVTYTRVEGTPSGGGSTTAGCDGHGTLNAHIIGGYNDRTGNFPHADSAGFHFGLGIAPFVKLGSSVIFDNSTNRANPDVGDFTYPDYEDMISRAYRDGARISSDSWGGDTSGAYDIDAQAYDALVRDAQQTGSAVPVAGNQGMTIVFAAGNAGSSAGTVGSPGTAKNVITVGAAENVHSHSSTNGGNDVSGNDGCTTPDTEANSANDIASFSSRGPCSDSRKKPEICAPGTHVTGGVAQNVKTMSGTGTALACFDALGVCGLPGGGTAGNTNNFFPLGQQWYSTSSGTSHSTPCVAGGAALVYQYFINQWTNPPSPAMVKAYLMNSARYMNGTDAGDSLWSNNQGMGMMNLGTAFNGVARVLRDQLTNDLFTATGQSRTFYSLVSDTNQSLRVTLGWTDAPGSTSGNAYNNDLNLVVTVGGVSYKGNVFTGAYSSSGGTADARDNAESVFLPAGAAGLVQVTVSAANINSDGVPNYGGSLDQDFALVVDNATAITPSNYPPVLDAIGNKAIATNQLLQFTVTANDPIDGDPVSLWAIGVPVWATFAGATNAASASCSFSGTTPAATGTYAVTFYAADKDGTNSEAITIVVNDCVQTNIIDEGFAGGTNAPAGWSFSGVSTYTSVGNYGRASPSLKFDANGDQVVTPALNSPTNLQFWIKGNGTDSSSALLVESYNGSAWSTVANLVSLPTTATTQSLAIAEGMNQIRFTYTKSAGNLAFDDVLIGGCGGGTAPNRAPTISVAGGTNQSVVVNTELSFVVTVNDADTESVGVFTNVAPAGASFPEATGVAPIQSTFTWTPAVTGSFTAVFVAYDALVAVTQSVGITVTEPLPELLAPVIQAASSVQANQFNANWLASTNATGHRLDVATNSTFSGGGGSDTLLDEGFATLTATTVPSGWTNSSASDLRYTSAPYYGAASPSYKFKATNQWLQSPTFSTGATNLQFWAFGNGGSGSTIAVSGLVSGVWTLVDTKTIAQSGATYRVTLDTHTTQLKFTFTKTVNCALDDVLVTGGGAVSSFVPGYDSRDLGDLTTYAVTGLTESVTYYYRVKAYTATSNSAYSGTTNVTTVAGVNVPPVLGAIGNKSVTVGSNLQFQVVATPTDSDTVTLTASNLPSGSTFNPTNENGTFAWLGASPTGVYSVTFYATDKDGSDSETISITVGSASSELLAPVIQAASSVQATQFSANWLASANATGYRLDVGTNDTFTGGGGGSSQSVLASNAATSAALITGDWSGAALGGTNYVAMTQSTSVVTSPVFSTVGFTNLTVDFRARTFGGASGTSSNITVSISTNNGQNWTSIGVAKAWTNKFQIMPTLTNTANLGFSQTRIRWQSLGATGLIGIGVSNLIVQGWSGGGSTPSYVPGYENRDVANVTTYSVTGLTEGVTYYYRAKAYNVTSNSPYSGTTSVVTAATSGTPPVLNPIGGQSVFLGETLQFQVSATPTEADAVTLTVSNLPAGAAFYPTNENGTFRWSNASPTGEYSVAFYATDKDGSDGEAVGIYVYPLPQVGTFTMASGTPASASFDSVLGQIYRLEYSTNIWEVPVVWTLVTNQTGTGSQITLSDTNNLVDVKRYYRITIP